MRVLDLGCGHATDTAALWPDAEIVRVDLDADVRPDVVADVRSLPNDIGAFDHVFAAHVLEHLDYEDALRTVQHWAERLGEGGVLHIFVPDLQWAVEQLVYEDPPSRAVLAHMYGAGLTEHDHHRWGYTALLLRGLLGVAGLHIEALETHPYTIVLDGEQTRARQIYARARRRSVLQEQVYRAQRGMT